VGQKKAKKAMIRWFRPRWQAAGSVRALSIRIPRTAKIDYRAALKEFVLSRTRRSPGRSSKGSPPAIEAAALARQGMEDGLERELPSFWQSAAIIVISPITIFAGMPALLLLLSSCGVMLGDWTARGAWQNLSMGFPALLAIASLWFSTCASHQWLAEHRGRFVATTTGLLVGLSLQFLALFSETEQFRLADHGLGRCHVCFLCGSLFVGSVNLVLLIASRQKIDEPESPEPIADDSADAMDFGHSVPPPHFAVVEELRPVRLEPYRPPPYARARPRGKSGR
jgi:hypothetical protein